MTVTEAGAGQRRSHVARSTLETRIDASVDLDGGTVTVRSGVPFLDHMLEALGRHGKLGIEVSCDGDAAMDPHHTVEDVGIVLGRLSEKHSETGAVSLVTATPTHHWTKPWRGSSSTAQVVRISATRRRCRSRSSVGISRLA